jgi:hypothetical protein
MLKLNIKNITIDTTKWITLCDIYKSINKAIIAPKWQDENLNALLEIVIYNDEDAGLSQPYRLIFTKCGLLHAQLKDHLLFVIDSLQNAKRKYAIDELSQPQAYFEIID